MTISIEDVRRLLGAGEDSLLVLIEGRVDVVSGDQLASDAYRGALEVISRRDLLERTGGAQLSDAELSAEAAALDTEVTELGG